DTLETGPAGGPLNKVLTIKYTKQDQSSALQKDSSIGSGGLFGTDKELVESGTLEQLAAKNHGADFLRVVNVVERIGIKENQIGVLGTGNRSLRIEPAEKFRGIARRGLQRFHRSQTRFNEELEFFVQTEAGENERRGGVGSRKNFHAALSHLFSNAERFLE